MYYINYHKKVSITKVIKQMDYKKIIFTARIISNHLRYCCNAE